VQVRGANARMDAGSAGVSEGFCSDFNVFLNGAAESADSRLFDGERNFPDTLKITGRRNREASLDDVHTKGFELEGEFDFFAGVEFATRHLLAVAQGGVENMDFFCRHGCMPECCSGSSLEGESE